MWEKRLLLPKVCTKMLREAIKLTWLHRIIISFYDIIFKLLQSKPNNEIPDDILAICALSRKYSTYWSKK